MENLVRKYMMSFESIKKRFDEAAKRKQNWDTLYRETLRYVAPERELFTEKTEGTQKRENIVVVDSTAIIALSKFISNLQSSLVPPMKRWTRLVPGDGVPPEVLDIVKPKLDEVSNIMFSSIQNSNFDTQIAETFSDLAIGTGALLCIKGDDERTPLRFVSIPLHELYLEEGAYGRIDTVFRKHKMEIRNIKNTWADAKVPEELTKRMESQPSNQEVFIECTYPSKVEVEKMETDEEGKMRKIVKTVDGFVYIVMHEASKQIIVERQQESSPWIVFRWSVAPGEIYGRGPALFALPDIKSINKTKELILKRASIDAAGMWMVKEDGVMNLENIQMGPHALIPVMETPGGMGSPSIAPLPIPGGMDVSQMVINDLRTSINEVMFADPLGPIDLPVKTATEVAYRQQELAKRIGSAFGRLQYELITPLINRILFVLNEWKLLPTDGDTIKIDGRILSVKHESPLAAAQDQESLMAIQQFIQFLTGTFGPQTAMVLIQPDKLIQHMAKYLNIPADIQLTQEQLDAVKQKIAQMGQMAEQGMQNQVNNGESIG
jgi:hypothetical protein